jgi:hypothetical protein
MIRDEQRDEVQRLLQSGELTSGQIARRVGVSRTTVWAIDSGRHEVRRVCRDDDFNEPTTPQPQEPPSRCRGCGGLVYPPCRLCRTRALPTIRLASD